MQLRAESPERLCAQAHTRAPSTVRYNFFFREYIQHVLGLCVPIGCFIFLPKNGYEILTVFRQDFFLILVSAVATTASRAAREWNGYRARLARTRIKRRAPQRAGSPHQPNIFFATAPPDGILWEIQVH